MEVRNRSVEGIPAQNEVLEARDVGDLRWDHSREVVRAQVENLERGEAVHLGGERSPEAERDEGEGGEVGEPGEGGKEGVGGEVGGQGPAGVADDRELGDATAGAGDGERRGRREVAEGGGVGPAGQRRRVFQEALEAEQGLRLGGGERLGYGWKAEEEDDRDGGDGDNAEIREGISLRVC